MHYSAIKRIKLDALTADTPFTLPAMHAVIGVFGRNHASLGIGFEIRKSGTVLISGSTPSNGDWFGVMDAVVELLPTADDTLDITCSNWPDPGIEVDVIILLVDLSI